MCIIYFIRLNCLFILKFNCFSSPPPHLARETAYHPFFFSRKTWNDKSGLESKEDKKEDSEAYRPTRVDMHRGNNLTGSECLTHPFFNPECWPRWIRIKRVDLERTLRSPSVFDTWALIEWQPMLQSGADGREVIPVWKEVDSSRHWRKRSGWRCCKEARWWKSRGAWRRWKGRGLNSNGPIERRMRCVRSTSSGSPGKRKRWKKSGPFWKVRCVKRSIRRMGHVPNMLGGWTRRLALSLMPLLLFRVWTHRGLADVMRDDRASWKIPFGIPLRMRWKSSGPNDAIRCGQENESSWRGKRRENALACAHPASWCCMGQFENAAEYLLAPDRCMMCRVETGHFLVYTFEEDRIDLLASPALYGREEGNRAEGEDLVCLWKASVDRRDRTTTGWSFSPWAKRAVDRTGGSRCGVSWFPLGDQGASDATRVTAKTAFWSAVQDAGIERVQAQRAHLPRINKVLYKIKLTAFQLADATLANVMTMRDQTVGCQEEACFRERAIRAAQRLVVQLDLKRIRLAIDWICFLTDEGCPVGPQDVSVGPRLRLPHRPTSWRWTPPCRARSPAAHLDVLGTSSWPSRPHGIIVKRRTIKASHPTLAASDGGPSNKAGMRTNRWVTSWMIHSLKIHPSSPPPLLSVAARSLDRRRHLWIGWLGHPPWTRLSRKFDARIRVRFRQGRNEGDGWSKECRIPWHGVYGVWWTGKSCWIESKMSFLWWDDVYRL